MRVSSSKGGRRAPALLLPVLLLAAASAHPALTPLGREQGLPSQQIHAVTQGPDGRMYFAGPSGLSVYDGQRVSVTGTREGLTTHGLRTVTTLANGRVAAGGDAGLDLQGDDGRFRPAAERLPDGWTWGFVDDMVAHPDGSLFIAASRGFLRWDRQRHVQRLAAPLTGNGLVTAVERVNGTICAAGPGFGLICGDGDTWQRPGSEDWRKVGQVLALAATAEGHLLVGGEYGLMEITGNGDRVAGLLDTSGRSRVTAMVVDGADTWAGLGNRLVRIRKDRGDYRVTETVMTETLVNDLYVDRIGSIWAATDNRAIQRVSALHRYVDDMPAPCSVSVMAVRSRIGGAMLAAGDLCSWIIHGNEQQPLPALDNLKVWDMLDYGGSTWAATDAGLLQLTAPDAALRHGADHPLMNAPARVLAVVNDSLWLGTVRGLVRQSADGGWEAVPVEGNAQPGYVYTIIEDGAGDVWVGTIGSGLWRWTGDSLRRAAIDGLPENGNAYAVAHSGDGSMAVSQDDRLYLSDGNTAKPLPRATDNQVAGWSLGFDGNDLWVGGSSGLLRLDAATGELISRYTPGLGRVGMEFTTSRSLQIVDDRFYVATTAGLSSVQPRQMRDAAVLPEIGVTGVVWRNDAGRVGNEIRYGAWSVDVHFFSPWYYDESSLRFRYRLAGFEEDWVEAGSAPVAHYTALPAGRYTLHAQAYSPLTGWGPAASIWTLSVTPPLWQHPLALLLYGLLLLLMIIPATAWRTRVIRVRSKKLERAVDERTSELAQTNVELQRLSAQKDRMVSVVAHDLRTPFAVSQMYAGVLEGEAKRNEVSETAGKAAEVIQRAAAQGINIIDSMLNLQAIESGRARLEPAPVEFTGFLENSIKSMDKLSRERRNVSVRLETALDGVTVECDQARIEQVLHNLVDNALKFSNDGAEVVVHLVDAGDGVTVAVQDFGVGIASDELDKIFKPYVRSTSVPVEHQVGLGIGLTICQRLIEQHGGSIRVDSVVGKGTTVSFFLPHHQPCPP